MLDREASVCKCYLIPGWCWPAELGAIYDLIAERQPMVHVEIGSFCGKSLFVTAAAMPPGSTLYSVEPFIYLESLKNHIPGEVWWRKLYQATLESIRTHRPDIELIHLEKTSIEAAVDFKGRLDSVYLDGDHNFAEVSADIEAWSSHSKYLFGHDYSPAQPGVMDAVNESFGTVFDVIPRTRIWATKGRT